MASLVEELINVLAEEENIYKKLTEYGEDDGEAILKKENIEIKIVTPEEFAKKITQVAHSNKRDILAGIINDLGKNNELNYLSNIKIKCDYTISYLKKIGFEWPEIEDKYIIKYIENIE